jgi:hypothetical protein
MMATQATQVRSSAGTASTLLDVLYILSVLYNLSAVSILLMGMCMIYKNNNFFSPFQQFYVKFESYG